MSWGHLYAGFHIHGVHMFLPDVFIMQNPTLDQISSKKLCLDSSFPEKVKNFFYCLTSVFCAYSYGSMSSMAIEILYLYCFP